MPTEATIIDAPPPSPPPAPTTEIHVSQTAVDAGPQAAPPKPGSARERMFQSLRSKAKDTSVVAETPRPTETPLPDPKPARAMPKGPAEETPPSAGPQAAEKPAEAPAEALKDKPAEAPTGKQKVNPWKLADSYKEKASKLEQEIAQLRTSALPEKERTELSAKLQKAEARAAELEKHMAFLDYRKSQEFQDKYQKPYESAWQRAMDDLAELTIPMSDGSARPIKAQDILDLVNLPLPKARELADQIYGAFANDVMAHRKEIRRLFDEQSKALTDAEENGVKRLQEMTQQQRVAMEQVGNFIKENWDRENQSIVRDEKYGHYFTPTESDAEANQRLAKGFELVDRAFSENPSDPRLTPEQRRAVIKRHAAVRNRAAAFGRMHYDLNRATQRIEALEAELKKFRASEPSTGGGGRATGAEPPHGGKAIDSVFGALRGIAK